MDAHRGKARVALPAPSKPRVGLMPDERQRAASPEFFKLIQQHATRRFLASKGQSP